jgi:hypothetical protein
MALNEVGLFWNTTDWTCWKIFYWLNIVKFIKTEEKL